MQRRDFIKNSVLTGASLSLPLSVIAAQRNKVAANDKIGVGLIGCKGMGWNDLVSMLKNSEAECIAICDIDDTILENRKADLAKNGISNPIIYKDYRKMLENKAIDVVIIATPDHWHCLQLMDACSAGKDVYCEKPLANSIVEARKMVETAQRYGRMVQVNQWQRSQKHFKDAIAYVHSGKLGKIALCKTWMYRANSKPLPILPNQAVPAGVDYNMWLGPAPKRTFNPNRFHYEFRWFWDYAGGLMTDWGVHLIDIVLMGMKSEMPKSIMSTGGKSAFPDDARETPDTQLSIYDFGAYQMQWEHTMGSTVGMFGRGHGIAFIGSNGTLVVNRAGWEVIPEKGKLEAVTLQEKVDNGLDLHTTNFLSALKARDSSILNCPIEAGAKVAYVSHMGNVAYRVGDKINYNDKTGKFDSKAANALLLNKYQNGWKLA